MPKKRDTSALFIVAAYGNMSQLCETFGTFTAAKQHARGMAVKHPEHSYIVFQSLTSYDVDKAPVRETWCAKEAPEVAEPVTANPHADGVPY